MYSFSDKDNFSSSFINYNDQLDQYNISVLKIYKDYLWIGNKGHGALQILDNDFKQHAVIDYVSIGNIPSKYFVRSKYSQHPFSLEISLDDLRR